MKNKKTQTIVLYAMFLAIELLIYFIPFLGFIPIGPLKATTLHIPVIIAGIILGKKGGSFIGLVFGLCSLINATINPTITSFVFTPFISGNIMSLIIAIVPRILIGYITGFIFEQLTKKDLNQSLSILVSSFIGAFTNTILVLGGIYFIFGDSYSSAISISSEALQTLLLTTLSTQGLLEAVVGCIISLAVCKALKKYIRSV